MSHTTTTTFPFSPNPPHISIPAPYIYPPIPLIPISSPALPPRPSPLPLSLSSYHSSQRWMAAGAYWSVRNGRSAQDSGLVDGEEMGDYFEGCLVGEGGVYDSEEEYDDEGMYDDEGFYNYNSSEEEGFYDSDDDEEEGEKNKRIPNSTLLSILHSPTRALSSAVEDFLADLPGLRAYIEADMQTAPRGIYAPTASVVEMAAESPVPTLQALLDAGKAMFGVQTPRATRREKRVDSPMRVVTSPLGSFRCRAARREFDAGLASLPPPPPRFIARVRGSE